MPDGARGVALALEQCVRQVEVRRDMRRLRPKGRAQVFDGLIRLPLREQQASQVVLRVRVVGLETCTASVNNAAASAARPCIKRIVPRLTRGGAYDGSSVIAAS